ncbi:MAG: DUF6788 family protein [Bryobacteraceae bacterium]
MKHREALRKRRKIAASLPGPEEVLRGSLVQRTIFHKRSCARCEKGEGHKVWVLTVTYPGGRNRQFSIRPEKRDMVKRWLDNYQEWKRKMEEICELNHVFLRPEE